MNANPSVAVEANVHNGISQESPHPKAGELSAINFRTLKLLPGMHIETQLLAQNSSNCRAQFLSAIHDKGVMLIPRSDTGVKSHMQMGKDYLIHGFTGQYDFSFVSNVIKVVETPLTYVMVSYPKNVLAKLVRRSIRIKTAIPALAIQEKNKQPSAVTVIDLSVAGAMIASPIFLGAVSDLLHIKFSVIFERNIVPLTFLATICHTRLFDDQKSYRIGLSFQNVSQNDKLVLHYLTAAAMEANEIAL